MLWLDGRRIEDTIAPFDLRDRGLLLGDGVFDTSFVLNGKVVFRERHMDRLASSCLAMDIPFDRTAAESTLTEAADAAQTGALRMTVTRGPGPRGLLPPSDPAPSIMVSTQAGLPVTMWRPAGAVLATIRRNETSPTSRHKCLSYLDAILELKKATGRGADEALFRNTAGHLACFATGNFFAITGSVLKTPPLADGVLAGIVRAMILELTPNVGLTPKEVSMTADELLSADAAFMTNSLRLIAPIVTLDASPLSTRGFGAVARLAHALTGQIELCHGSCPWIQKGLAAWPISA